MGQGWVALAAEVLVAGAAGPAVRVPGFPEVLNSRKPYIAPGQRHDALSSITIDTQRTAARWRRVPYAVSTAVSRSTKLPFRLSSCEAVRAIPSLLYMSPIGIRPGFIPAQELFFRSSRSQPTNT